MDKRTLSPEELAEMKYYIKARSYSFKEPGILAEILDHFACKTEELLNERPALSFKEAMHMAHESFGVKGLAPIAAAWEANTRAHYKQWFRKNAFKTLISLHGLGIAALSLFVAQLYWHFMKRNMLPLDGYEVLISVQLAGAILFFTNRTGKSIRSTHPMLYAIAIQAATFGNYTFLYLFPVILFRNHTPLLFQTILIDVVTFAFVFFTLIQAKLNKAILADTAIIDNAC